MLAGIALTRKEKAVPRALFGAIAIMLLPFFLSNVVLKNSSYMLPLMLVSYSLQLVMLVLAFWKYFRGVSRGTLLALLWLLFFQIATFLNDYRIGWSVSLQDVAGALAKCVNFVLLFGLLGRVRIKKSQLLQFMTYFVYFSFVACLYNIVVYWSDIMRFATIQSTYELNLQSFFANRNQFGAFLFVAIVAHSYVVTEQGIKVRNAVIYAFQILCVLLTMSRGAILISALFLGLRILKRIKQKRVLLFAIVVGMLGGMALVYIVSRADIVAYIFRIFLRTERGTTGRGYIWNMGIDAWKHNVITGVGYYTGLAWAKAQGFRYGQFHNMVIDILVSGGLAELFFFAFVFVSVITRCKKRCMNENFKAIYFASLCSVFVLGLVESVNFFSIGYADSLWTISFVTVPLLMANMRPEEEELLRG